MHDDRPVCNMLFLRSMVRLEFLKVLQPLINMSGLAQACDKVMMLVIIALGKKMSKSVNIYKVKTLQYLK